MVVTGENVKKLFTKSHVKQAVLMQVRCKSLTRRIDLRAGEREAEDLPREEGILQGAEDDRDLPGVRLAVPLGGTHRLLEDQAAAILRGDHRVFLYDGHRSQGGRGGRRGGVGQGSPKKDKVRGGESRHAK